MEPMVGDESIERQECEGGRGDGTVGGRADSRRRQIHVGPEKVGTSFCLHFVLFSSRDNAGA
jgi:hypothetical protein